MEVSLEGRVVIVTGTTSGIGRATTRQLLARGAAVIGVARRPDDSLAATAASGPGTYMHIIGDVRKAETARDAVDSATSAFGRLDVVVNNAGVGLYADFIESDVADYDEIMDTNMRSTYLFCRAAVPVMATQGSGLLLQISSQAGVRGFTREAIYCASKHAQVGFTRALRRELQPLGIKVGVICPAGVKTEFAMDRGRTHDFVDQAPFLSADDVADAVMFATCQSPSARMVDMGLISLGEAL